ncbi:glycosyltransferase [uncultured Nocardioides sp.]|uniref:glycosyltransferase n=1 Tax=uncultured Nocardioides sp. TaxID=198441 RepID=UPI00261C4A14|nr:glycosyltransferase [uncultured Nocardioides sp.]
MNDADLTVILNAHREGALAHPTLRALHRAVAHAAAAGLHVEVLAVLDNGDDPTRAILDEAIGPEGYISAVASTAVLEVSVADLGLARNLGVARATAPFITVLDADNLPSENWLLAGHRTAVAHDGPCVVHPATLVIFEGRTAVWPQWSTDDEAFRAENFFDQNYWDACCLAARQVFEEHPYAPTGRDSGFGPEDWHWNTLVVHAGVPHLAAKDTALFYRAKLTGSLMGAHRAGGSLIHQTPLLTDPDLARSFLSVGGRGGRTVRRIPLLRRLAREAVDGSRRTDPRPPAALSRRGEALARVRPGFVEPAHYRYLYDLGELSDAEAIDHFRSHAAERPRGWLTAEELEALRPKRFRADHYRALHADVVELRERSAVRLHWLDEGRREGRRARLTPDELAALAELDLDAYRDRHADLTHHDDQHLVQHYLEWGIDEERRATFDIIEHTWNTPVHVDDVLANEWRAMHRLEPWIPVPTDEVLRDFHYVGPPADGSLTAGSSAWWHAVAALEGTRPDVAFFAPWVRLGGGDLLLAHYARAVRQLRPDAEVVVVTTHGPSDRLDLIDPSVRVVDLPSYEGYGTLTPAQRCRLVAMLVTQLRPGTVHAFNSPEAFDAVQVYKRSLGAHSALFLSTFTIELGPEGGLNSHLLRRPSDYLDAVDRVIVDSRALVDQFHEIYRMDPGKFLPLRQPVHLPPRRERPARESGSPLRVLWAARFDRQKRLDLLADVAEAAAAAGLAVDWTVYGEPVTASPAETARSIARLEALGARFHAAYRSVDDLPLVDIDLFLMTSETEGVPNTMLEMMAREVPFMGPLVGGVPEVLDDRVGWPITSFDDVDAYVAALRHVIASPEEARRRAEAARAILAEDFSWEAFLRRLEDVPGYLP